MIHLKMKNIMKSRKTTDSTRRKGRDAQADPDEDYLDQDYDDYDNEEEERIRRIKNKVLVRVSYLMVALFLSMAGYLIYFNVVLRDDINNNQYNTKQSAYQEQIIRGNIYSADGNVLAQTDIAEDGTESRSYPYSNLFAHIVGYATNGKSGIESVHNYDLLSKYSNYIVGEVYVPVEHVLLGCPDAKLSDIKTVYSHPQALMQCSDYLNARKDWSQISVLNTAAAAKKVMEEKDKSQAAIASHTAGELYGLKELACGINNAKGNTTRFLVLANRPVYGKHASKISVTFEIPHISGSLYNILGNFIFNGVNMVMIESRPIPEKTFEYRFFVDIEGNLSDASVQNALNGLKEEASFMRILGNY